MANINKIKLSGTTYNIQDLSASKTVELTQAQYDALVSGGTVDPNTFYIITDAQGADLSQYYTSAQTESAITQAVSGKQDTLISGTNIKTINNESLLGSGNITIQGGGGSSYTAGDGIDITNDVISVTGKVDTTTFNTYSGSVDTALSGKQDTLSAGTGIEISGNVISATGGGGGKAVSAGTNISVTTGETADTINCTLPITVNTGNKNVTVGYGLNVREEGETSIGKFNINRYNNATTHSENTIFTVGNGGNNSLRHNALEIRKNGDLYFADTSNDGQSYYQKPMVRLQDMYGALGGLKLVKLTQSEYDALSTKDSNTLYVIVN